MPKTQTEYHTKYRMVMIPPDYAPSEMEKLMETMSQSGWTPVTFVPDCLGATGRITGHMLMARVER